MTWDMSEKCVDPGERFRGLNVLNLPVELLVYIVSFLPTVRDKVKLRYVSRTLRVVSETPSLWSEFVWPLYDRREEHSVMNVLKTCGDYIKRLVFPDHVPPISLIEMLSHCNNVTQLSLPPVTKLDSEELRLAVQHMKHLEKLEVQLSTDIKPLLQIVGLKELTVHVLKQYHSLCPPWVEEWSKNRCVPCNLNLVIKEFERFNQHVGLDFVEYLSRLIDTPLKGYTSFFKLYYHFEVPLNFFPNLPVFQLEIGQTVIHPFVSAAKFDMLDLECDIFLLTDRVCNGKRLGKADNDLLGVIDCSRYERFAMNSSVVSLDFITEFTFSLDEDDIETLAKLPIACPNIQRLSIRGCTDVSCILEGLRTIALHCLKLHGLNLLNTGGESLKDCHLPLWEILSEMKLTHLHLETCAIFGINSDKQKLVHLFQKCSSLQALQIEDFNDDHCQFCEEAKCEGNWKLLSHFPALKYCRLHLTAVHHFAVLQDVINSCKQLTILSCFGGFQTGNVCTSSLQQLSIMESESNPSIPDTFMDTVSAHGGLVHVVLAVGSVSNVGITSLVRNSPNLLTCLIAMKKFITDDQNTIEKFDDNLQQKFSGRKLFAIGRFRVAFLGGLLDGQWDYIPGTDLFPLWWRH